MCNKIRSKRRYIHKNISCASVFVFCRQKNIIKKILKIHFSMSHDFFALNSILNVNSIQLICIGIMFTFFSLLYYCKMHF